MQNIIIYPLFYAEDIDEILCNIYINNNLGYTTEIIENISLTQVNNLEQLNRHSITMVYVMLGANFINIFDNIQLPKLKHNKIKNALFNLLEDKLLLQDNEYLYHKNQKLVLVISSKLLAKLQEKMSIISCKLKWDVYILPMAKYLEINHIFLQNYTYNNNIYTVYTCNKPPFYGLCCLQSNDINDSNLLGDNLIINHTIPDYTWNKLELDKSINKEFNFNLNLNNHSNNSQILNKILVPKWLKYLTIFAVLSHICIMQTIVFKQNLEIKEKKKNIATTFKKFLPNEPMLEPIKQLNKLQTINKNDAALVALDKLQPLLVNYTNYIQELNYKPPQNAWQISMDHNMEGKNISQQLIQQATSLGIKISQNNNFLLLVVP